MQEPKPGFKTGFRGYEDESNGCKTIKCFAVGGAAAVCWPPDLHHRVPHERPVSWHNFPRWAHCLGTSSSLIYQCDQSRCHDLVSSWTLTHFPCFKLGLLYTMFIRPSTGYGKTHLPEIASKPSPRAATPARTLRHRASLASKPDTTL